jgi:hypothetical protein
VCASCVSLRSLLAVSGGDGFRSWTALSLTHRCVTGLAVLSKDTTTAKQYFAQAWSLALASSDPSADRTWCGVGVDMLL